MIVELLDKLISKAIDLLKEEQRAKKSLHDDFVMPLMNIFEEVHNNYIMTFINYREVIINGPYYISDKHKVIDLIKKDSLSSGAIRVKTKALLKAIEGRSNNSNQLILLLKSIARYLDVYQSEIGPEETGPSENTIRVCYLNQVLIGISKECACQANERIIENLQSLFFRVQVKYQNLKSELIK